VKGQLQQVDDPQTPRPSVNLFVGASSRLACKNMIGDVTQANGGLAVDVGSNISNSTRGTGASPALRGTRGRDHPHRPEDVEKVARAGHPPGPPAAGCGLREALGSS
jgi:hypothetical protein